MIREAIPADIQRCLEMARRFAAAAYPEGGFVYQDMRRYFASLMNNDNAVLLVTDKRHGMLGGTSYGLPFNANYRVAQELFWWVDPKARGTPAAIRLLTAFEAWAARKGARQIGICDIAHMTQLERLLARKGYSLVERTYRKCLSSE